MDNTKNRIALRDALIVAMVNADMTRKPMYNCHAAAGEAHQYVAAASKIAREAYPLDLSVGPAIGGKE